MREAGVCRRRCTSKAGPAAKLAAPVTRQATSTRRRGIEPVVVVVELQPTKARARQPVEQLQASKLFLYSSMYSQLHTDLPSQLEVP